jgi:hypothetical protein
MNVNLDKKAKSVIAVYAIIAVVYVLGFLIIPFNKCAASWISFGFTIAAVAISLLVCGMAFRAKETIVSKVYGFPVFRIGAIYAIAQLVVGVVICAIGAFVIVPYWIALLLSVLLLAAGAIGVIATDNARDMVEEMDESVKAQTKTVTCFQISIAGVIDDCENADVKADLEALNELFKYSDPVTNAETQESEEVIKAMLAELKAVVSNGTTEDVKVLIKKISNALNERNRICKASK